LGGSARLVWIDIKGEMMATIAEGIKQLARFSEQGENISDILVDLGTHDCVQKGESVPISKRMQQTMLDELRGQLKSIASDSDNDDIQVDELSLSKVAYYTLLTLAEFRPKNTEDPIMLVEIAPEKAVFISTGQQFDIHTLIQAHNTREPTVAEGEDAQNKWLRDPLTNIKFSPIDDAHIREVAAEKNIVVIPEPEEIQPAGRASPPAAAPPQAQHEQGFFQQAPIVAEEPEEVSVEALSREVAHGQLSAVENLPRERAELIFEETSITDPAKRTYPNASLLQKARWDKDPWMLKKMLRLLANTDDASLNFHELVERLSEEDFLAVKTQLDELKDEGIEYTKAGVANRSSEYDFSPCEEKYNQYIGEEGSWLAIEGSWLAIGKAQDDFPAHYASKCLEVGRWDKPKEELRVMFSAEPTPYSFGLDRRWFSPGLGLDVSYYKGSDVGTRAGDARGDERYNFPPLGGRVLRSVGWSVRVDLVALSTFDEVVTAACNELSEALSQRPVYQP